MAYEDALKMPFLFHNKETGKYVAMFAVVSYQHYNSGWMDDPALPADNEVWKADVDIVDREEDQKIFDTEEEAVMWLHQKCSEQLVQRTLGNKNETARMLRISLDDEMKLDN